MKKVILEIGTNSYLDDNLSALNTTVSEISNFRKKIEDIQTCREEFRTTIILDEILDGYEKLILEQVKELEDTVVELKKDISESVVDLFWSQVTL